MVLCRGCRNSITLPRFQQYKLCERCAEERSIARRMEMAIEGSCIPYLLASISFSQGAEFFAHFDQKGRMKPGDMIVLELSLFRVISVEEAALDGSSLIKIRCLDEGSRVIPAGTKVRINRGRL